MATNTVSETPPAAPYVIDAQFTEQFLPHICDPISQLEKTLKVLHYQQIVYVNIFFMYIYSLYYRNYTMKK